MNQDTIKNKFENDLSIKEELEKYLSKWYWFLLGIILCSIISVLYIRYTIPKYKAAASIKVKDEAKGGLASELAAFSDMELLGGVKNNVDNEVAVLGSKTLIGKTILELGLNVDYTIDARVRPTPAYEDSPIKAFYSDTISNFLDKDTIFFVQSHSLNDFKLLNANQNHVGVFNYNSPIKTKLGVLNIKKNIRKNKKWKNEFLIQVHVNKFKHIINDYKSKLTVEPLSKTTSIINLSFTDVSKERAEDFINHLIYNYEEDGLIDKNLVSKNTADFINKRLNIISEELDGVEKQTESFKKSNKLTDIISESGLYIKSASEVENELIKVETEKKVIDMMTAVFKSNNKNDLIPANILPDNGTSNSLIQDYNNLILERQRIASSTTANNSSLHKIDNQIYELKSTINESISNLRKSINLKANDLNSQAQVLTGKITQIPRQERQFRVLARQQQVKEGLYLYLLQKREEAEITLNVNSSNSRFIDKAISDDNPVSPKKPIILLFGVLLGILIPFLIFYIYDLFDTKVKSSKQIKQLLSIPFIGDVPKSKTPNILIQKESRTPIAESIRILKTNIDFILNSKSIKKTIFVTSTFPKEGKTFITLNLATSYAHSGKKVLVIGLDIRNPQLKKYFNELPMIGVTNYITSNDKNINNYIYSEPSIKNLDLLPAGVIPPNPTDLLESEELANLFSELKQKYDYIFVDTAPVSLVTDTQIIAKYADAFIYVIRDNYLDKRMLYLPEQLYQEHKLPNMSVVLNQTEYKKSGYGYGYGYQYGYGISEKKPWYKFWKK